MADRPCAWKAVWQLYDHAVCNELRNPELPRQRGAPQDTSAIALVRTVEEWPCSYFGMAKVRGESADMVNAYGRDLMDRIDALIQLRQMYGILRTNSSLS